ncbi:hypothetical protein OKW45_007138 [Paraburkholderia sp. WSM4175]|uniref:hypothetical protein n=1 Tax=Paraburkholderia sp. WSM4175 TaxID=2991072 RepID=UPI003D1ABA16
MSLHDQGNLLGRGYAEGYKHEARRGRTRPDLSVGLPDGHNWHFIDVLTGKVEEITAVIAVLSDARRKYIVADE